eukprot:164107_1
MDDLFGDEPEYCGIAIINRIIDENKWSYSLRKLILFFNEDPNVLKILYNPSEIRHKQITCLILKHSSYGLIPFIASTIADFTVYDPLSISEHDLQLLKLSEYFNFQGFGTDDMVLESFLKPTWNNITTQQAYTKTFNPCFPIPELWQNYNRFVEPVLLNKLNFTKREIDNSDVNTFAVDIAPALRFEFNEQFFELPIFARFWKGICIKDEPIETQLKDEDDNPLKSTNDVVEVIYRILQPVFGDDVYYWYSDVHDVDLTYPNLNMFLPTKYIKDTANGLLEFYHCLQNKLDPRVPVICGNASCSKQLDPSQLRLCSQCRLVAYCSRNCQRKHWKAKENGHKQLCECNKIPMANEAILDIWKMMRGSNAPPPNKKQRLMQ